MRRGFLDLSAQVQTVLPPQRRRPAAGDPVLEEQQFSDHVFVFRGRRGDIVKVLWFDGDGLCLLAKRLERGWTYVRDDRPSGDVTAPAVWFAYSPNRKPRPAQACSRGWKGEHPRRHLAAFSGTLQVDTYDGVHHLYEGGRITEAACWAHVRRKFHDIHAAHASPTKTEAIKRIVALYAIAREIRGSPPELRTAGPQSRSTSLLAAMRGQLETTLTKLSRSPTPRRRSATHCRAGMSSPATTATGPTISAKTPPTAHCGLSPPAAKTSSSPARTPAVSAPRRSTRCSAQPGSTGSTRSFYLQHALERIADHPLTASTSSCPGTPYPHPRKNKCRSHLICICPDNSHHTLTVNAMKSIPSRLRTLLSQSFRFGPGKEKSWTP